MHINAYKDKPYDILNQRNTLKSKLYAYNDLNFIWGVLEFHSGYPVESGTAWIY